MGETNASSVGKMSAKENEEVIAFDHDAAVTAAESPSSPKRSPSSAQDEPISDAAAESDVPLDKEAVEVTIEGVDSLPPPSLPLADNNGTASTDGRTDCSRNKEVEKKGSDDNDKEEEEEKEEANDDSSVGAASDGTIHKRYWAAGFRQATQHLRNNRGAYLHELYMTRFTLEDGETDDVMLEIAPDEDHPEREINYPAPVRAALFNNFVEELESGACDVRELVIQNVRWHGLPVTGLRHLFGTVLPNHKTIESIEFDGTYDEDNEDDAEVLEQCVALLASSIHTSTSIPSPLRWLGFRNAHIDLGIAREIAGLMRRTPPHLQDLYVCPEGDYLEADAAKVICDAVAHNTSLPDFHLKVNECEADTLDGALGRSSPLRYLNVDSDEDWTHEAVAGIAANLRINLTLDRLELRRSRETLKYSALDWRAVRHLFYPQLYRVDDNVSNADDEADDTEEAAAKKAAAKEAAAKAAAAKAAAAKEAAEKKALGEQADDEKFQPILDALKVHNFTLRRLVLESSGGRKWSDRPHVSRILSRNCKIQFAFKTFGVTQPAGPRTEYLVEPASRWPLVLRVASDMATPLYRLVRHGAVKALCEHGLASNVHLTKKRKRNVVDDVAHGAHDVVLHHETDNKE